MADTGLHAEALSAAATAARSWARVPWQERLTLIDAVRERLQAARKPLADLLVAEGAPRLLAEWQINGMDANLSEETKAWYARQLHQEHRSEAGRMIMRRQPDGVVGLNPPANAPASNALFAAIIIAAGNAAVVRLPRLAPLGAGYVLREVLVPALEDIAAPPALLSMLCAPPSMVQEWLESPLVNDILYFGTSAKGLALEAECLARRTKPILELSGNDGLIVWRDADLDGAVESAAQAFIASGQICMVPNYVLVHPDIADTFLARLTERAAQMRPGYPDSPGTLLTPVADQAGFSAFLDDALAKGAELITGGRRLDIAGAPAEHGAFREPTIVKVTGLQGARSLDAVREETFFPLLPVIVPGTKEARGDERILEAFIDFLNANAYGLRNSLWSDSPAVVEHFLAATTNGGRLTVNDSHTSFAAPLATHGGTGLSGDLHGEANYPLLRTSHLQCVHLNDTRLQETGTS
ncbi:aldehyde dehydrogenase [Streptomyces sp. R28]|uniref:Aldehyde dehydrogenase n=1 Tax=Streptomyces sp. R28 TaxID=3238628 RepID=A0AB39QBB4_9ACTN